MAQAAHRHLRLLVSANTGVARSARTPHICPRVISVMTLFGWEAAWPGRDPRQARPGRLCVLLAADWRAGRGGAAEEQIRKV